MKRRTFLNWLGWLLPASSLLGRFGWARPLVRPIQFDEKEVATLRHIGASALPSSLGESGANEVVAGFLRWLRDYVPAAKMPHHPGRPDAPRTPKIAVEVYEGQLAEIAAAAVGWEPIPPRACAIAMDALTTTRTSSWWAHRPCRPAAAPTAR